MLKPLKIDLLLFGHTHIPYHRIVDNVHMINMGSVGKPKDGDSRACYTIIDLEDPIRVTFRRVPYPLEEVMEEIKQSGLPIELAAALQKAGN
jgi:diadenosine tetraphosphatase ApaH/serine/threonine PP2A family protein phosphatase